MLEGVLHKVGQKYKTWKKRTMILRNDNIIYYYKDTAKNHLGVIPLTDSKCEVREGTLQDCNWPRNVAMPVTIVIRTELRTFYTYAESLSEASRWKTAINKALETLKGSNSTPGQSRALKSKVKKDRFYRQATKRYQEENGTDSFDDDDDDDEDNDDKMNGGVDTSPALVKGTDAHERRRISRRDNTLLSDDSD